MKIWYDGRMLGFSGIGTQVQHTMAELFRRTDPTVVPVGDEATVRRFFPNFKGDVVPCNAPIYSIREQISFPVPEAGALLHVPHYAAPIRFLSRSVVVVHDLIHLQSAEFSAPHFRFYAWTVLKAVAARAAAIVTVSNYTRDTFLDRFPEAAARTTVIHNGIDRSLFFPAEGKEMADFRVKYNLPESYFLCVGIGKRHKNVDFLIRAMAPLWKSGTLKMPLVIGGTGGALPEYVDDAIRTEDVSANIRVMPYLETEELRSLYSAAKALLMPSLLEGFGFPVAEAMACGTPVLSSNRASLPEIGEKAALYFNPEDEEDVREKIMELIRLPAMADRMSMEGVKRAARFTWEEHVDLLTAVYRRLSG